MLHLYSDHHLQTLEYFQHTLPLHISNEDLKRTTQTLYRAQDTVDEKNGRVFLIVNQKFCYWKQCCQKIFTPTRPKKSPYPHKQLLKHVFQWEKKIVPARGIYAKNSQNQPKIMTSRRTKLAKNHDVKAHNWACTSWPW